MHTCEDCDGDIDYRRWALGYRICKDCGEEIARQARKLWTVAPMHKSNYLLVTNRDDLVGLNNKGGQVRT